MSRLAQAEAWFDRFAAAPTIPHILAVLIASTLTGCVLVGIGAGVLAIVERLT